MSDPDGSYPNIQMIVMDPFLIQMILMVDPFIIQVILMDPFIIDRDSSIGTKICVCVRGGRMTWAHVEARSG